METSSQPTRTDRQAAHALTFALSHPLRAAILNALDTPASIGELAKRLDEPRNSVAYHVGELEKFDCVEVAGQRRSAQNNLIERVWCRTRRAYFSDSEWEQLPASARATLTAKALQVIAGDWTAALEAETFESRADRHVSRSALHLDDEGWAEVARLLSEVLDRAHECEAESRARGSETRRAMLHLLLFEGPPRAAD